jgi:hypothetical protein
MKLAVIAVGALAVAGCGAKTCLAPADYASVSLAMQQLSELAANGSAGSGLDYFGAFDTSEQPDGLEIDLYDGYGPFADANAEPTGLATGTFDLSTQNQFVTCGACVFVDTQVLFTADSIGLVSPHERYLATGGTLAITQIAPTFTAMLTNGTFTRVGLFPGSGGDDDDDDSSLNHDGDADDFTSADTYSRCDTAIDHLAISTPNPGT